jgi:polysaccharide biosynthesis protein PslH
MRIVFCCFYEAYPPASGAATVSYNLARFASGSKALVQLGPEDDRIALRDNVEIITLAWSSASRYAKFAQVRNFVRRMVEEVQRAAADMVILEGASWAVYHWMLLRAIRHAGPRITVIYHSHNVEYYLRLSRNGRFIATLTRWAEGRLVRNADFSTAVSEIDQSQFEHLYRVKPSLLPNGVDIERFASPDAIKVERLRQSFGIDMNTVIFAGFYAYGPNREAIDFLVRGVMPSLRQRHSAATLALTGGGAPYHESWIRNVGSVPYEDFPAFVAACGIAVAPIFSGSGTRLKILEAMAAGVPVVATEKAAEGLSLRHGEDVLFAHSELDFVNCVMELLYSESLRARLREAGRRKVRERFSWPVILRNFERDILTSGTIDSGICARTNSTVARGT